MIIESYCVIILLNKWVFFVFVNFCVLVFIYYYKFISIENFKLVIEVYLYKIFLMELVNLFFFLKVCGEDLSLKLGELVFFK